MRALKKDGFGPSFRRSFSTLSTEEDYCFGGAYTFGQLYAFSTCAITSASLAALSHLKLSPNNSFILGGGAYNGAKRTWARFRLTPGGAFVDYVLTFPCPSLRRCGGLFRHRGTRSVGSKSKNFLSFFIT